MLAALTGTPGTGKSTVASHLARRGMNVIWIDDIARQAGALGAYDEKRGAWEVDNERVEAAIPPERPLLLVGHLSHQLRVDLVVVLRCHPETLRERLSQRGWSPQKVRENMEAEALDIIGQEAMEKPECYQVDTSSQTERETVRTVENILTGRENRHRGKRFDWSEVILDWY